jgi:hypothetical protein
MRNLIWLILGLAIVAVIVVVVAERMNVPYGVFFHEPYQRAPSSQPLEPTKR